MDFLRHPDPWIAVLGVLASCLLAWLLQQDEKAELVEDAQARADLVASVVQDQHLERQRVVARLAQALRNGVPEAEVRSDAAGTVADHPDILAIARLDGDRAVWTEPAVVEPVFASFSLAPGAESTVLKQVDGSVLLLVTADAPEGDRVVMALAPTGFVGLGLGAESYALAVRVGPDEIYREPGETVDGCARAPARLDGVTLDLSVCPRPAHAEALRTVLPEVTLLAGVGLSLLLGRVLALDRAARRGRREAEHALGELASFTYAISHDFRAPVRALQAYSRLVAEGLSPEDDAARGYLGRIELNARHIAALVDGILALARTAQAPVQLEPVDVTALVEAEVARLREECPKEVRVEVQPGAVVRADEALLGLVLRELLKNAWAVSEAGGAIRVGVKRAGWWPAVYVRDEGPGFDTAFVGQLFRPFQRTAVPAAREGVGLGLALAHTAVRRMGGRIWADATPGRGATFWVVPTER